MILEIGEGTEEFWLSYYSIAKASTIFAGRIFYTAALCANIGWSNARRFFEELTQNIYNVINWSGVIW